jgi:hypothetical protein
MMSKVKIRHNESADHSSLSRQEGLSAHAIYGELVEILCSDAIAYSTVSTYLGASRSRPQNAEWDSDRPREVIDNVILQDLDETALASVCELAKST